MRPPVSFPGLVEASKSLPFSWKDFNVSKEVFFTDLEFLDRLAVFWKRDPDFAREVAFYRVKYVPCPVTFPVPNSSSNSHQPAQPVPRAPASPPVPVPALSPAPVLFLIPAACTGSVSVSEWVNAAV
ncbi:hypothetical protein Q8A73_009531 [Channa argus]|nr:hypothetical protein Q8A73_009531 [Channa argus]